MYRWPRCVVQGGDVEGEGQLEIFVEEYLQTVLCVSNKSACQRRGARSSMLGRDKSWHWVCLGVGGWGRVKDNGNDSALLCLQQGLMQWSVTLSASCRESLHSNSIAVVSFKHDATLTIVFSWIASPLKKEESDALAPHPLPVLHLTSKPFKNKVLAPVNPMNRKEMHFTTNLMNLG